MLWFSKGNHRASLKHNTSGKLKCCTVLYSAAKSAAELEMAPGLDLDNVASWMKEKKLFLDTDKTEYIIYGTRQKIRIHDDVMISYNETPLKRSTSFKYLGSI